MKDKMENHISIVVPVYNTGELLAFCLDSIAKQSMKDIEVIVVDDGSNDKATLEICSQYHSDNRFRIFHNENKGVSESRNFGIEQATGKYVMFVDSDDWLEPTMCQAMYDAAEDNQAEFVICGNYNESTAGSQKRELYKTTRKFEKQSFTDEINVHTIGLVGEKLKNPPKLDKLTPVWARLYRRDIIEQHHLRFIDLHKLPSECLQFNIEYILHVNSAYYLNEPLYHYKRNTVNSVTKPYRDDLQGKWNWWYNYFRNNLLQNLSAKQKDAFFSRCCCSVIPLGGNAIKLKGYKNKREEVKRFLHASYLQDSFGHFNYGHCPFYWKLFFYSAKNRQTDLFLFLTVAMRKILERRKK